MLRDRQNVSGVYPFCKLGQPDCQSTNPPPPKPRFSLSILALLLLKRDITSLRVVECLEDGDGDGRGACA